MQFSFYIQRVFIRSIRSQIIFTRFSNLHQMQQSSIGTFSYRSNLVIACNCTFYCICIGYISCHWSLSIARVHSVHRKYR